MDPDKLTEWWGSQVGRLVREGHLTAAEGGTAPLIISDDPALRRGERHYAACDVPKAGRLEPAGPVYLHRDALDLDPLSTLAILAHEMGHVLDHSEMWRGAPGAPEDEEQRADWLAERVLGLQIGYDQRAVQSLACMRPRPTGLR